MQATLTTPSAASFFGTASFERSSSGASASARQAAAVSADAAPGHAVDSSALLQGQKAVSISHNGSVYRLQATKLGKLILTK